MRSGRLCAVNRTCTVSGAGNRRSACATRPATTSRNLGWSPQRCTSAASSRPPDASSSFFSYAPTDIAERSEEHTSELQSPCNLVCRLLLEKKKYMYGALQRDQDGAVLTVTKDGASHTDDKRRITVLLSGAADEESNLVLHPARIGSALDLL